MDYLLDQNSNDIVFDAGDIKLVSDEVDLLAQRLYLRFKTFKRELFWNRAYGIDYINQVFGNARPKITVDTLFKNEILSEVLVDQIISFTSSVSNYYYGCQFSVKLRASETIKTYFLLQTESGLDLLDENGQKITTKVA